MRNWINIVEVFGGSTSFPGRGLRLFPPIMYEYIASILYDVSDEHVKTYLINWFIPVLQADNPDFDETLFRELIATPRQIHVFQVKFQARHYYYLAHFVKAIADQNAREFVCNWLADHIGRASNPEFRMGRWKQYCGLEITPLEQKLSGPIRRHYADGVWKWPQWYQDYLDSIGEYHDPRTGRRSKI